MGNQRTFSFSELITATSHEISDYRFWHLSIPPIGIHTLQCSYYYVPHFFSLWQLCPSKGKGIKAALLDTGLAAFSTASFVSHTHLCHPSSIGLDVTEVHTKQLPLIEANGPYATHGTHCYGIINARHRDMPIGIAPCAEVFMVKACNAKGASDIAILIKGLKKAIDLDCKVVNIGLAFDSLNFDDKQTKKLITLMQKIPYLVVPSGNQGLKFRQNPFIMPTMPYPAAFEWIAFDVGAFGYDASSGTYPVCAFSQFQKNCGPKFIEPGFNIVSTSIPTIQCNDPYMFLHGTSMACALMTGFVILMLAEFESDFSKQQLLKVCYTSCIRLHDNKDWKEKVMLGTLDMRTALFTLHVLKYLKVNLDGQDYSFETHFDNVLKAIQWILHYPLICFEKKYLNGVSFFNNFVDFNKYVKKIFDKKEEGFVPKTVNEAIKYVGEPIIMVIKKLKFNQQNTINVHDMAPLKNILYGKIDLFDRLNDECKKRISKALL